MGEHVVAPADELDEGDRLIVELEGRSIGVFNIEGEYYAYTNWCPHQSGPLCEGELKGTTEINFDRQSLEYEVDGKRKWVKEGEILRCPWHAWEFDVKTGECMHDAELRIPSHPVTVDDGNLIVSL